MNILLIYSGCINYLNKISNKMEKLSNDKFKAKDVGRGIWHLYHSVAYSATCKDDIKALLRIIVNYDEVIRCGECKAHSNFILNRDWKYLETLLMDPELTDSEVIASFCTWLYNYHREANNNAGKDPSTQPTEQEVLEYYLNYTVCNEDCTKS